MPAQGYTFDDLLWAVSAIQEARYAIAAMYGLHIYEWINCLEKEIKLIYRARWTSIKLSYFLCRYYPLICWPIIMWAYLRDHTFEECEKIGHPIHVLLTPYQFFSQAVMLMRAYAFCGRDWRVLLPLGLCYGALLGINVWAFATHVYMPPPIFYALIEHTGCYPNYGTGVMAIRIGLSMLAATLMDLVSLVCVLIYCKKESSFRGGSLAHYFIKQGLGSFLMITVINVAAAIAFFKPPSYHSGIGLPLSLAVSNLLACRVILQLRRKVTPTPTELSRRHSLVVDGALNNLQSQEEHDVWLMDSDSDSNRRTSYLPHFHSSS
ncbi:hypothetical protein DFP72DRAFT_906837 [Ephemerocybe angulata]|uniref:DUF6533 domain-containing protein n=1 Tax=Ephemerocybe angulata TaxID=980116 RepID=A0A8H6M3C3_9AGAR|nr:hypothetical protein DFP72DRAFT_906837 [Tulosesus angulatus]